MNLYRPSEIVSGFHVQGPIVDVPHFQHAGEQWAPSGFKVGWHSHSVWELYLQNTGTSEWALPDGRRYLVRAGDILAMPPSLEHCFKNLKPSSLHFHFIAMDLNAIMAEHANWDALLPSQVFHAPAEGDGVGSAFRDLTRELTTEERFGADGLQLALKRIALEFLRACTASQSNTNKRSRLRVHPSVGRARALMEKHPGEHWKLETLAKLCGIAPSYLAERFREDLGVSPKQHLTEIRLRHARRLLRESDLPLTEIAGLLGFSSSQHFSTFFRRHCGHPPSQLRPR